MTGIVTTPGLARWPTGNSWVSALIDGRHGEVRALPGEGPGCRAGAVLLGRPWSSVR